jgi:hypothetical protein
VPAFGQASRIADWGSHSAGRRNPGDGMIYGTFKASDVVILAQAGSSLHQAPKHGSRPSPG